jgi:hypothetical protein
MHRHNLSHALGRSIVELSSAATSQTLSTSCLRFSKWVQCIVLMLAVQSLQLLAQEPITCGATVQRSISGSSEQDHYSFTVAAGEVVRFVLAPGRSAFMEIRNANGAVPGGSAFNRGYI